MDKYEKAYFDIKSTLQDNINLITPLILAQIITEVLTDTQTDCLMHVLNKYMLGYSFTGIIDNVSSNSKIDRDMLKLFKNIKG